MFHQAYSPQLNSIQATFGLDRKFTDALYARQKNRQLARLEELLTKSLREVIFEEGRKAAISKRKTPLKG